LSHRVTLVGFSDIGRVRKRNEDAMTLVPEANLAIVADGMGGHPGGDVASRVAASAAAASLVRDLPSDEERVGLDPDSMAGRLGHAMAESVLEAHRAVRAEGEENPALTGMGTTITAVVVDPATGAFALGHVGDSRAYLLRNGELVQLTRDDTWVQDRVDAAQFTLEQARHHPFGHLLTQCLGLDDIPEPSVRTGRVAAGDTFLLCTDGLVGMLEDTDIAATLRARLQGPGGGEAAARVLVETAKERGGHDNITVVLAMVE
jgi:protein phosphatase